MGWKAVKEKFCIKHNVQVTDGLVCIGSGYVHNLLTINAQTGVVHENPTFRNFGREKYPELMDAKPDDIAALIAAPDTFERSITVYTYEGSEIIEKLCEEPGWPNATHDGLMMFENTFSTDLATTVRRAKRNAACAIEITRESIERTEKGLAQERVRLATFEAEQAKLDAAYPAIVAE